MPLDVLLVVLLSAWLHAGWNALVRSAPDKYLSTLLMVWGAGAIALVLLPLLPAPAPQSWPYLAASALIHGVYFTLVAASYRHADLSLAYPVMRGTAPVLAGAAWRAGVIRPAALWFALGNAAVIAAYTLVDGQGTRLSGHAFSYTGWLFLLTALLMLGLTLARPGRAVLRPAGRAWRTGLLGGAGTLAAYGLVLWAMTRAPIAAVAALRETSIVFAALIGVLLLGERMSRLRWLAVLSVCAGAVVIKLA